MMMALARAELDDQLLTDVVLAAGAHVLAGRQAGAPALGRVHRHPLQPRRRRRVVVLEVLADHRRRVARPPLPLAALAASALAAGALADEDGDDVVGLEQH